MAAGRRPSPNVAALLVLGAVCVALLVWQRPWAGESTRSSADVPAGAPNLIEDQLRALSEADDRRAFVAAAGTGARARELAEQAWRARESLGVEDVDLRYVGGGDVVDRSDGTTLATIRVTWEVGGDSVVAGPPVRDAEVSLRLRPRADGFDLSAVEAGEDDPLPLWLAGGVEVRGDDAVRVVSVDGGVPGLATLELARSARAAVEDVVPDVDTPLTVVAPRTRELAAALLGTPESDVERIAGVTTTLDGTAGGARVVVLNPVQFEQMDDRADQVVLTHEATHALTGAVGSVIDSWVAEGYADWVALRRDDAPLALSAGQALAAVRADGPPERLPTAEDFAGADHGLGAVYESAWLVFRMLDETEDDATITAFYRDVLAGTPVPEAVPKAFGTSVEQLTERWRDYLAKSASTVS